MQNFRNYGKKEFKFDPETTLFLGPNAVGKTNILEAIYELAIGHSFRADEERELIRAGEQVSRIVGKLDDAELEIIWDQRSTSAIASARQGRFSKLYRVNGVGKRLVDFAGLLRVVLFEPQDIEIVADSPATRRRYLDSVLTQTHRDYRVAVAIYERALRRRNKLLFRIKNLGLRIKDASAQMEYWDNLLIQNGGIIHERRKKYLEFVSGLPDQFFPIACDYNHSIISEGRLKRYENEEMAAGMTLVGPHRDDFIVRIVGKKDNMEQSRNAKSFGSRGEQRMAVFTMKMGELEYVRKVGIQEGREQSPMLLLDDIFSELDHTNRHRLLEVIPKQQTIMTTTDLHLVQKEHLKGFDLVELELKG